MVLILYLTLVLSNILLLFPSPAFSAVKLIIVSY